MRLSGRRGSYGVDAPYMLIVPFAILLFNITAGVVNRSPWPLVGAGLLLLCAATGLHASRRGKFLVWGDLLDQAAVDGESRVLDIGCGRGAVLTLVAGHLTTGRAVGIDLWKGSDQSGNSALATRRNAEAEGVARRIDVCTADMRALPFADGTFDLIVSNIAIHNVPGRDNRARAIDEAVRVLRPGGRLMVADIFSAPEYRARLDALGLQAVEQRNLGWRMWWGGPWVPTRLVTARKRPNP
jgi:arsenite methyltransferase